MSDRQTEQERDVATLATIREFMDVTKEYDNAQDGHSIRDGTRALLRIIDRLTAERDAAHEKIVSFGSTMADLIMLRSENERLEAETVEYAAILEKAVKESKALVAGYNKAIEERNAARAENTRLRAHITKIAEACEMVASSLEANLGYSTGKPYFWSGDAGREIVQHTLSNAVNNLRAALESEADHD